MDILLINEIKNGVIKTIKSNFSECAVYGEPIAQGMKKPCFYVNIANSCLEPFAAGRFRQKLSFEVRYFSSADKLKEDICKIAVKLHEAIVYVQTRNYGLFRTCEFKHIDKDEAGMFTFEINFPIHSAEMPGVKMQKMNFSETLTAKK